MRAHQDHYIHELTPDQILSILINDAWKAEHQSVTSSVTNDNDLPAPSMQLLEDGDNTAGVNAFYDIQFDSGVKRILDVGGGQFDCNRQYMKRERNVDLLVWDPFNRTPAHNASVKADIMKRKADAVTSMSVLNVVPEPEVRLAHITTLKAALVVDGKAYFKIWPGERPLRGSYLPAATTDSYQANSYADRFMREIEIVFGIGNVSLSTTVPNLIVAMKKSGEHTPLKDIRRILRRSSKETPVLAKLRERSIQRLYFNVDIMKVFTRQNIFNRMAAEAMLRARYHDRDAQREHNRQSLVVQKRPAS